MDNMDTLDLLTFFFISFMLYAVLLPRLQLWNLRRSMIGIIGVMERGWESKVLAMVHKGRRCPLSAFLYASSSEWRTEKSSSEGSGLAGSRPIDVIFHPPGRQLLLSIQNAKKL